MSIRVNGKVYDAKNVEFRIGGKVFSPFIHDEITEFRCACETDGVDGLYCSECERPHPIPDDLAKLVEIATTTPDVEWIGACYVLADALLERGLMRPLRSVGRAKKRGGRCSRERDEKERRKAERTLARAAFEWARAASGFKPGKHPPVFTLYQ